MDECFEILGKIICFPIYLPYLCWKQFQESPRPRRRNYQTIGNSGPRIPRNTTRTSQPSRPAQRPSVRPQTNPAPQRQLRTAPAPQRQQRAAPAPQQRPRPYPTRSIASNDQVVDVYAGNEEAVYLYGNSETAGLLLTEEECFGVATDREAYAARVRAGLYLDEDGDVSAVGVISEMYTDGNNFYQQDTVVELDGDDFDSSDSSDDNVYYQ